MYSPPARLLPLESAAVAKPGAYHVQGEGGIAARVFGPDLLIGAGRLRTGIADSLEVSGEAGVAHVLDRGREPVHPNIYALRLGARYQTLPWLTVGGGIGGGGSAGGGFVAPDANLTVAFENPYFVPFAAVRVGASVPLSPRAVDVTEDDVDASPEIHTPEVSGIWGVAGGARVPLRFDGEQRASLLAALRVVQLFDHDSQALFIALGGGIEIVVR